MTIPFDSAGSDAKMIVLGEGQSAEPLHCGSCHFFMHRQAQYDTMGVCSVCLPPWVRKRGDEGDLNEVDPRTVRDIDRCSLYQPKHVAGQPVQFSQERVWHAGKPSR